MSAKKCREASPGDENSYEGTSPDYSRVSDKFVVRFRWAVFNAELPGPRKLVLFALSMVMEEDGSRCHPSESYIADKTGLGERTVRRHIKAAVKEGWLLVKKTKLRNNKSGWINNVYVPLIPVQVPATVTGTQDQVPATVSQVPATDDTSPGQSGLLPVLSTCKQDGEGLTNAAPLDDIFKSLQSRLPSIRVDLLTDKRRRLMQARWDEDERRQSLKFWEDYFAYVHRSDFLMGRKPGRDGTCFRLTFEFLFSQDHMLAILEGNKYHDHAPDWTKDPVFAGAVNMPKPAVSDEDFENPATRWHQMETLLRPETMDARYTIRNWVDIYSEEAVTKAYQATEPSQQEYGERILRAIKHAHKRKVMGVQV